MLPTEPTLCEEFGFSRTVIREGLKLLEERGLVRVEQGRGTTVQPRSSWDLLDPDVLRIALAYDDDLSLLDDLISVRRVLEREMARAAAGRLTEAELEELARPRRARWRRPTTTTSRFREYDNAFHAIIMRASGNEIGVTIVRVIHRYGGVTPPLARRRLPGRPEAHGGRASRDPRGALRAGDGELAGELVVGAHRGPLGRGKGASEAFARSALDKADHSYDDLTAMRIAAIDVDLIPLPAVTPPFAWRRGLRGSAPARTTAVLRITTDDGAVGEAYHEWSGPMLADIVDRVLREELVGERADRREWLWHRLWELDRTEEFPIWLFGVVDVALWDLEGRILGVPVHRLLGTYRDAIPAYASTTTFSTVEEYLDVVDQCLELGYPAIKLHAWGDARADADLCQRVRAHVGAGRRPDVRRVGRRSICPTRCTSVAR